jgi:hypothetical protein
MGDAVWESNSEKPLAALSNTHQYCGCNKQRGGGVNRVRKFGERRHWAVPSAFVAGRYADPFARRPRCHLGSRAFGLPRCPAFLSPEAMVAGHLKWAVGVRSAPQVEQDLRGTT